MEEEKAIIAIVEEDIKLYVDKINASEKFKKIINRMLAKNPNYRCSA